MSTVSRERKQAAATPARAARGQPGRVIEGDFRQTSPQRSAEPGSMSRDVQRFVRLLRIDPQLRFLRGERSLVVSGLESSLRGELRNETAIDMVELARSMAQRVITPELRRLARELIEDSLRFRPWKAADSRALATALTLVTLDEEPGDLEDNPVWAAVVALSVENLISVEHFSLPDGCEASSGTPGFDGGLEDSDSALFEGSAAEGEPRHYLFQRFFWSAHRVARLITQEKVTVVVRLYEVLPMFLAVFRVWADQSAYGQLPAEMLPTLHGDVISAFHKAAARTIDPDVLGAIAAALQAEGERCGDEAESARGQELLAASQFSSSFAWELNPIVTQLLLRLCSSPEICCVGPGAAEAVKLAGDPTIPEYYHGYGQALLSQGELRAAGRVFAAGLEFLGNHWRGLTDLALVYRALGEEKVARKTFKEALAAEDLDDEGKRMIRAEMAGISTGVQFGRGL